MCHSFSHGDELECLEHETPETSHRAPTDGVHLTHSRLQGICCKDKEGEPEKDNEFDGILIKQPRYGVHFLN